METVLYKNTQISYTDTGKGRAVVLLHGFLENKNMWEDYTAVLSKKNRIISIDLLGHGQTAALGYVQTMEENAEMIRLLLTKLKIRKAVVLGHSMGGYVALALAEGYPQLIKGLILLNSTAKEDSPERKKNRSRAIIAVKKDYESFIRLSISNLFSPENRDLLSREIEQVKIQALKTPLQGIVASLEGMKIRKDRQFILQSTNYPKLLILGQKDPVLDYSENIAQIHQSNTQLVSFPDGHMSSIENKAELLPVLQSFFKDL